MSASAYIAGITATAVSVMTLLACVIMVPMVYQKAAQIQMMVDTSMSEFKVRLQLR